MKFDVILTNPPFQDTATRGKTRHKLWIDFTEAAFGRWLTPGGLLCQISPSSFRSPSSSVLDLFRKHQVEWISFDSKEHFPEVASLFSHYLIRNAPCDGSATHVREDGREFDLLLDEESFYLPNVLSAEALSIHRKVIFESSPKLPVERDYVTCHNILLKRSDTLSKTKTERHVFPVLHTNRQTWWSSVQQDFATEPKVMWSRSGYTKPFFDPGELGTTDMCYFVRVSTAQEGLNLEANLKSELMRYIFATARWSGFGNERVFDALPMLPFDRALTDDEIYELFAITDDEVGHVRDTLG